MSVNVKELISGPFASWVNRYCENIGKFSVNDTFWVVPMAPNSPEYPGVCKANIKVLNDSKIVYEKFIGSVAILCIKEGRDWKLCVVDRSGRFDISLPSNLGADFSESSINFLQSAWLVSKYDLAAKSEIPIKIINTTKGEPAFEADLQPYFPTIITLKLNEATVEDTPPLLYVKLFLLLEEAMPYVVALRSEILDLAYSIPEVGHEFVFDQLISAVCAKRYSGFFIELYKLFEFFFPMNNVISLKNSIGTKLSELKLLEFCKSSLGWSMNHQSGARAALSYTNPDFAKISLKRAINLEEEDENKFKEKGLEVIVRARHSLVHQDFQYVEYKDADLEAISQALLVLLRDAFETYKQKIA